MKKNTPTKNTYPRAVKFQGQPLLIEAKDVRRFMDQIKRERPVYKSKDAKIRYLLHARKRNVAAMNKELEPEIDSTHYCETCGSRSGKCHPQTGYCFLCDTDNWTLTK